MMNFTVNTGRNQKGFEAVDAAVKYAKARSKDNRYPVTVIDLEYQTILYSCVKGVVYEGRAAYDLYFRERHNKNLDNLLAALKA